MPRLRCAAFCSHQGIGAGRIPAGRVRLIYCLENPEQAEADGYTIEEVQRMFVTLA